MRDEAPKSGQSDRLVRDFVSRRAESAASNSAAYDDSAWRFLDRHFETLHRIWIYGLGFAVTCAALHPFDDWKWLNLIVVPVVTLFAGSFVALAELPTVIVGGIVVTLVRGLWSRWVR